MYDFAEHVRPSPSQSVHPSQDLLVRLVKTHSLSACPAAAQSLHGDPQLMHALLTGSFVRNRKVRQRRLGLRVLSVSEDGRRGRAACRQAGDRGRGWTCLQMRLRNASWFCQTKESGSYFVAELSRPDAVDDSGALMCRKLCFATFKRKF